MFSINIIRLLLDKLIIIEFVVPWIPVKECINIEWISMDKEGKMKSYEQTRTVGAKLERL